MVRRGRDMVPGGTATYEWDWQPLMAELDSELSASSWTVEGATEDADARSGNETSVTVTAVNAGEARAINTVTTVDGSVFVGRLLITIRP